MSDKNCSKATVVTDSYTYCNEMPCPTGEGRRCGSGSRCASEGGSGNSNY